MHTYNNLNLNNTLKLLLTQLIICIVALTLLEVYLVIIIIIDIMNAKST